MAGSLNFSNQICSVNVHIRSKFLFKLTEFVGLLLLLMWVFSIYESDINLPTTLAAHKATLPPEEKICKITGSSLENEPSDATGFTTILFDS